MAVSALRALGGLPVKNSENVAVMFRREICAVLVELDSYWRPVQSECRQRSAAPDPLTPTDPRL